MVSLISLAASLSSFPDSPTFFPNLGKSLPPKRTKRTTAMIRISGANVLKHVLFVYLINKDDIIWSLLRHYETL